MSTFSAALMLRALDGLAARQTITAQNIANASTPNYRPLRVSFERALADAARTGKLAALAGAHPQFAQEPSGAGDGDLRIDLELGTASSTAMRYAALVELLGRQLQLDELAVKGNG